MNYNEIISVEDRTNADDIYKIQLFREGDWWRAYEWSALLACSFPNSLDGDKNFKVTKRSTDILPRLKSWGSF